MTDISAGGPDLSPGAPLDLGAAGQSGMPMQPPLPSAQDVAPQQPSSFGSSFRSMLPGPNYTPPDPKDTALDQSASLLTQRVARANQIATNPLAQIFAPEQVQAARDFVPQATEKLQQIQKQKADIQAGRVQAQTLGLDPSETSDQATQEDRLTVASAKALSGDLRAFQGIQAVAPDKAAAIAPQVHEAVGAHLDNAQSAFDSLASMQNEGQYQAKLKQLRTDGTVTALESLGLKIPQSFDAFNAAKAGEGRALREARIALNSQGQALEQRNTYQPMETKEQETYKGALKTVYGDELNLGPWSRNGATGTRGQLANGIATVDQYGKTGAAATAEQRKELSDAFKAAVPEKEIEKYRGLSRISTIATKQPNGTFIPPEGLQTKEGRIFLNTNPNVLQGVSETLAAELREGQGGANSSLLNIEASKRGAMQALLDKIRAGYSGAINVVTGDQVKAYLTQMTQQQQRQILDGLREYSGNSIADRGAQIAQRAGALGLDASALGLGEKEAAGGVGNALEQGRQAQVERMRPYFQPIGAGNGVLQYGAQAPGAGAAALPPGSQQANQLPGAQPLLTPVQQATQNPPGSQPAVTPPTGQASGVQQPGPPQPQTPAPGGPGSQPSPVTIAGQQISTAMPAGASPTYPQTVQRIESGNQKNPWVARTGKSSAGGAFQAIKATWDQYKPDGAPENAKDATPQQQADFLSRFTAANASVLTANKVPVNDTSLYVAHNLGGIGGVHLLAADPNADARTIVGDKAANNNPQFFKGKPTVAVALQRYAAAVQGPQNTQQQPGASEASGGNPMDDPASIAWNQLTPEQQAEGRTGGTGMIAGTLPAAASTAGGLLGGMVGGPPGAVAGGAAGGYVGNSAKNYLQGKPQDQIENLEQSALGGVLGVASEARPLLSVGARALGSGTIEAGTEAAKGGSDADIIDAGLKGVGYALVGEALGRFVSMGGAAAFKGLSRYTKEAQSELSGYAGKLSVARETLKTESPDLPGDAGPNPKYEAAQKAEKEAIAAIKDHGQNPDDMVHAYEQAKAGVSAGEAAVMRKAASEKAAVGAGYNDVRQSVQDAGVGTPKPDQPLPKGPLAQVRTASNPTGSVEAKFTPDAEHAEMLMKAPAKDWGEKWQQLQNAGSELIQKRMAFLQNGDKPSADAMDGIFKGVRNQQKAAAEYVFGPQKGAQVIDQLENLDQRYAKVMNATQGMNYGKMRQVIQAGNTPERRALEKNFTQFAGDDPSAMRAFNAMKAGAKGRLTDEAKLMVPLITAESLAHFQGVPTLGVVSAAVGGHRLYKVMQEYANAKVLGRNVTFQDFFNRELKSNVAAGSARTATQRAVVQGQPDVGASAGALP